MGKLKILLVLLVAQIFLLAGCESDFNKRTKILEQQSMLIEKSLSRLKEHVAAGHIPNVSILKQYAKTVKNINPDAAVLADALGKDATPNGPLIEGLELRLSDAKSDILSAAESAEMADIVFTELQTIQAASKSDVYGMMLTDPINVLADMSSGKLPRVAAMSKEASSVMNKSEDFGTGSQLVGNPHYGGWRENSSGQSYWAWYGQYAFFSSMFGRPIYYNSWGYRRDYSYYHDYGRSRYTSPSQRTNQNVLQKQTSSKFKNQGKTFNSPYAKTRKTTATVAARDSKFSSASTYSKTPKSKTSPFSKKTSTRSSAASKSKSTNWGSRSSSYQSSRSSFGGK